MKHLSIFLLLLSLLTSCKKEKTRNPNSIEKAKLSKVEYLYNGQPDYTETYAYDGKGRLSGYTYDIDVETFEYVEDNFLKVTRRHKETNVIAGFYEAVLNDKGAITDLKFKDANGQLGAHYTYTYDAEGYMIKRKSVNVSVNFIWEVEYKIMNGNLLSVKVFQNGIHTYSGEYSFDNTHEATVPHTPDYLWISATLFGKPLKNVATAYKLYKVADGSLVANDIYTNQYDATGRLKTQSVDYKLPGKKGIYNFTY
jgi:hypothetical protein